MECYPEILGCSSLHYLTIDMSGLNTKELQKKWCGEAIAIDPNEEGLWIIPAFEPEPVQPPKLPVPPVPPPDDWPPPIPPIIPRPSPTELTKTMSKITIQGDVPIDSWADIFRSFVNPAARMGLKKLRLGVDFELVMQDGQPLDENDPRLKAMIESARQLGLDINIE